MHYQYLTHVCSLLNLSVALPLQSELGKGQQPPILSCDIALLVFNPDDTTSVQYAIDTSNTLPYSMPRLFICASPQSSDNNVNSSSSSSGDDVIDQFVPLEDSNEQSEGYNTILEYCKVSLLTIDHAIEYSLMKFDMQLYAHSRSSWASCYNRGHSLSQHQLAVFITSFVQLSRSAHVCIHVLVVLFNRSTLIQNFCLSHLLLNIMLSDSSQAVTAVGESAAASYCVDCYSGTASV
jgi:hypothetical protein